MAQDDSNDTSEAQSTNTEFSEKRKRHWWQFSLRTLLVVVLISGCLLGWISSKRMEANRQQRAWNALVAGGGGSTGVGSSRNSWQKMLLGDDSYSDVQDIFLSDRSSDPDTDLPYFTAFTNLRSVSLEEVPVTDAGLAHLAGHKNLKRLSLIKTRITDQGLSSLAKLTQLEELYLGGNPQLSDEGLKQLRNLTQLKKLGLDDTQVKDSGFMVDVATFKQLEALYLSRTSITDESLVHLASLPQLRELWLYDTKMSDADVEKLKAALPKCGIVHSHQSGSK